jgi:hypothetical protein
LSQAPSTQRAAGRVHDDRRRLPALTTVTYYGFLGPQGRRLRSLLNSEVNESLKSAELRQHDKGRLRTNRRITADFAALIAEQLQRWR